MADPLGDDSVGTECSGMDTCLKRVSSGLKLCHHGVNVRWRYLSWFELTFALSGLLECNVDQLLLHVLQRRLKDKHN